MVTSKDDSQGPYDDPQPNWICGVVAQVMIFGLLNVIEERNNVLSDGSAVLS
jgi:hypothetical protein